VAERRARHDETIDAASVVLRVDVVAEEEQLVVNDWTTEREPALVVGGLRALPFQRQRSVDEGVDGLRRFGVAEVEAAAFELIRAGLQRDAGHRTARAPEFRIVIAG